MEKAELIVLELLLFLWLDELNDKSQVWKFQRELGCVDFPQPLTQNDQLIYRYVWTFRMLDISDVEMVHNPFDGLARCAGSSFEGAQTLKTEALHKDVSFELYEAWPEYLGIADRE